MDDDHVTTSDVRLASLLETAVDGIIIVDRSGTILVYNAACERLFGYTADEAIGENVKLIMPSNYANAHDGYMENYLTTGERKIIGIGREVAARHKDGTVFPIELSVGDAKLPDQRQFIGIMRDLRPRMESQQRLNDLQDQLVHMARVSAMDEMGATLAHELNQPLTAIMLYLDALKRVADRPQEARQDTGAVLGQIVEKTVREADRAGAIIRRLRQFVERKETDRQSVDLRHVVSDAVDLASLGARALGIDVRVEKTPDPVICFVDPIQIQQVMINLVRNAIDAIGEAQCGQRVDIACSVSGAEAIMSVSDDGPGIEPAIREKLFKAFTTTKESGLGIGLAIAQSIAQNHGGTLAAQDRDPGSGTVFELRLPLDVDNASGSQQA